MTKCQLILLGLLFLGLTSFQEKKLPKTFTKLLDRGKMTFSKPDGLNEVPTIENDQMNYEYALKYSDKNFEVRYAIRPLDILMKEWGATTFVTVGEEFGQSYKYCVVVAIHKDDIGDAYIFFLSDTKVGFDKNMQTAFHSLRFN